MSATETIELSITAQQAKDYNVSTPQRSSSPFDSSLNACCNPLDDQPGTSLALNTRPALSTPRLILTIFQPSLVNFFSSFTNGVITVGLPIIARSIDLPRSLYLWPSSVYGLTSGAMLLIAGAIADIIGPRSVELVGILILSAFTLACGFAQTGIQLVVFRALQGVGTAMHLPASVSIIATAVPPGKVRNVAFGCLGLSQPLGFSVGLVLSGIMIEKAGWKSGFYLSGGATLVSAVAAYWIIPNVKPEVPGNSVSVWEKMWKEIDWIGGVIASGGLAILAYVLAILSADLSTIKSAQTASLLAVSLALLVAFPFWMHYRERAGKPALIPNSLWNVHFSATCLMVAISYGAVNSNEIFSSLYFQEVQNSSVQTTSLYLLPSLVTGTLINLTVGLFVDRVPARWLVGGSSFICAVSPLMMALVSPAWKYWYLEFWAQVFAPFSVDVLFTVGLIIVSDSFPEKTQALAGAVFNTVAQFGFTMGVGVCQVVALGVMSNATSTGGESEASGAFEDQDSLKTLKGYRAGFWTMFASMVVCGVIAVFGLRKAGKIGLKKE